MAQEASHRYESIINWFGLSFKDPELEALYRDNQITRRYFAGAFKAIVYMTIILTVLYRAYQLVQLFTVTEEGDTPFEVILASIIATVLAIVIEGILKCTNLLKPMQGCVFYTTMSIALILGAFTSYGMPLFGCTYPMLLNTFYVVPHLA